MSEVDEMVERVARALWEVGSGQPWTLAIEPAREHMRKLARVAINEVIRTKNGTGQAVHNG